MSAVGKPQYTYEEYLARERSAAGKSEYYCGQIFAMAGGSVRHNTISGNLFASLRGHLRGSICRPFLSDQRIRVTSNGLATYPDVSIVCGEIQVAPADPDAIINPGVIIEVISRTTESYDRGKKFDLYRQIESLREYLLVSQEEPHVEHFVRQHDDSWLMTVFKGLDARLELQTGKVVPLSEIYEDVKFGPEDAGIV